MQGGFGVRSVDPRESLPPLLTSNSDLPRRRSEAVGPGLSDTHEAYSAVERVFPPKSPHVCFGGRLGSSDTALPKMLVVSTWESGPLDRVRQLPPSNSIRERRGLGRLPSLQCVNQTILKTKFKTCHPKQQALAACLGAWFPLAMAGRPGTPPASQRESHVELELCLI